MIGLTVAEVIERLREHNPNDEVLVEVIVPSAIGIGSSRMRKPVLDIVEGTSSRGSRGVEIKAGT